MEYLNYTSIAISNTSPPILKPVGGSLGIITYVPSPTIDILCDFLPLKCNLTVFEVAHIIIYYTSNFYNN